MFELRNLYFNNARRFVKKKLVGIIGCQTFKQLWFSTIRYKKIVKLKRDIGIYYYKLLKGLKIKFNL